MVREKVIGYVKEALKRGYTTDMIMQNLIDAGHDSERIKNHVREAIQQRIDELSLQRKALFGAPYQSLDRIRRR